MFRIDLPIPPSVNQIWKRGRHGVFLSQEARDFYTVAVPKIKKKVGEHNRLSKFPISHKIYANMTFYWNDGRCRDSDNYVKCVKDALQKGGLVSNDRFIEVSTDSFVIRDIEPKVIVETLLSAKGQEKGEHRLVRHFPALNNLEGK